MADEDLGLPADTLKFVNERVDGLEARMQREITHLFLCKHNILADRCGECRGMTALGVTADILAEILRRRGLLYAELSVEIDGGGRSLVRHRRPLKKLIGIGIGVSVFAGFAWQGGKVVLRLVNRKPNQRN